MLHDLKSYDVHSLDDDNISVKYDGTIVCIPLIDYQQLVKKANSAVSALENEKQKRERVEASSKECVDLCEDLVSYTTLSWYQEHKGAKKGCGRLADAMILANAVRGMSLDDIQEQYYPYKKNGEKKKYNRRKIFSALSVKRPEDKERIDSLLLDFPEVFEGIDREAIYGWMEKKYNKGGKSN